MKTTTVLVFATVAVILAALAGTARASTVLGYWVSENSMSAKLQARYDYAYCHGLRRYGTHSLNTVQWGWVPGYFQFECAYDTQGKQCFGGRFESDNGRHQWYIRMLSPGRCYAR